MAEQDRAIEALRERIETRDKLSAADSEILLEFSDQLYLLSSEYSDHRHVKLLRHCVRMAEEVGGLADALEDRDAAEELVKWIHRKYNKEETNRDYRVALRVFGRRVTNGNEPPESIDWISSQTSRNYDPAPDPADMLHWEDDVLPMIDATMNSRDAALIAVAWDSGARSGEIRNLTIGNVTDHQHGLQITVDGKTGKRTVTLIPSVPHLQRWLQDHPASDDSTAPLWSKLHQPDDLSYRMFVKILREAAERAGVTKPMTLTNFRKSSASYLASRNMNQAHIEDHHGWTRGSDVASRYVSVFGKDSDRELAKAHGLEVTETEPDPIAPLECPRCGRETPREEDFCVWCGQTVNPGAAASVREQQRDIREAVLRLVNEDPELLDDIQRAQDLMTVVEDDPELLDDANRFVEALQNES